MVIVPTSAFATSEKSFSTILETGDISSNTYEILLDNNHMHFNIEENAKVRLTKSFYWVSLSKLQKFRLTITITTLIHMK
jgi:hypothetical protein